MNSARVASAASRWPGGTRTCHPSEQWAVGSGQWRVESGEWRVESGEWRVGSEEWAVFRTAGKKSAVPPDTNPKRKRGNDLPSLTLRVSVVLSRGPKGRGGSSCSGACER